MRERRLFTEQPLAIGAEITLEPRPTRHALQALRLQAGDQTLLFNGDGCDYTAEVTQGARGVLHVRVLAATEPEPMPPLKIGLALGISRGERMDLAIQKAVELGVGEIQPLFTSRSVVRLQGDRLVKRSDHWRGVIIAACEQSGRRRPPALATANLLEAWLESQHSGGILLHHEAARTIADLPPPGTELRLLVGPEGGLSPAERDQAKAAGFIPVRLGPRVLRTETAPLAAIAAIQTLWGDFGPVRHEVRP
jgi:16S rRNA (uracil1498-N3)-methyltransferase